MLVLFYSYFTIFNPWGILGLILGSWIIIASFLAIILSYKLKLNFKFFKKINSHIAHIGVGIAIIGITCSSVFKNEYQYNLKQGDEFNIKNNKIIFENVETSNEKNYQALRINFVITDKDRVLSTIKAGKNYYPTSKIITTEAGILHQWFRDVYFIVGEQKNNEWFVKVYVNPFVSFIWLGVIILIYSGFIGATKR